MDTKNVKILVTAPLSHADIVREAMGKAGAGKIGNYSFCSISSKVIGRSKPEAGADPYIGEVGEIEAIEEEKIEVVCERELLQQVIKAIKDVHPYDELALEVIPLEDI